AYVRVEGPVPPERPFSNVTGSGAQRVVHWVDAKGGSGSDGGAIDANDLIGEQDPKTGIYALNRADLFNILCIPPLARDITALPSNWTAASATIYQAALSLCVQRRAMLIVDPDPIWATSIDQAVSNAIDGRNELNLSGTDARNAALYFP